MEKIQIREDYKDYSPAIDVVAIVRKLLAATPSQYLIGLDSIVLRNVGRSHPKRRRFRFRGRKRHLSQFGGLYHHATRDSPAWIELYPDNIFPASTPRWMHIILAPDIFVAGVLFHEIGHHIDQAISKERDGEAAAERWRKKLMRNYAKEHYWYLRPFRKVIGVLIKLPLWLLARYRKSTHSKQAAQQVTAADSARGSSGASLAKD